MKPKHTHSNLAYKCLNFLLKAIVVVIKTDEQIYVKGGYIFLYLEQKMT